MAKYKEREYIPEPPEQKTFNGKSYKYDSWHWGKKGVLKAVKKLRDRGYFARAVIVDPGWAVYRRKRPKIKKPKPPPNKSPRITPKLPRITPKRPALRR